MSLKPTIAQQTFCLNAQKNHNFKSVNVKGVPEAHGRLHRLHDMKTEVIIYDYADLNIPMLVKMYGRRVSGYKAIGYEINE
ncbi:MAG: hypothetical protein KAU60_03120 [Desulfobacterales bacterium]|nr:hypothetical protein [Desulfobacterales bacterium]